MDRIIKVGRMQLINKWTFIGIPLTIVAGVIVLVAAIGLLVPTDEPFYTGAGQSPLWYFFAIGMQALTLTFPFSQGLSISRRVYFIGTVGTFSLLGLGMAVLYWVLSLLETATNGWGGGGRVFAMPWITDGSPLIAILFFWLLTVFFFLMGMWGATIYKRWGPTGILIACVALVGGLIGVAALISMTAGWPAFGSFLVSQTPLSVSGWLAVLALLLGTGSYLTLRRAQP